MTRYFSLIFFALLAVFLMSSDFAAYRVFEKDGVETEFDDVVDDALDADIVFFGEMHNNPISHWLQLELLKQLHKEKEGKVIIGAEMFESDDQMVIDEYLGGIIRHKDLEKEAKIWKNYPTDYEPIMKYADDKKLRFIATNIPRRYASLVSRGGFEALDSLNKHAKMFIAPLPIDVDLDLPGYKKMEEMMGHGSSPMGGKEMDPEKMKEAELTVKRLKQAQAVKDATMAHFILKNYKSGDIFYHLNGAYHSNNFEGIVWFIKKFRPDLKILTITTVEEGNTEELKKDNEGLADYIIVVPENMTKTY